jgi:tRNA(fMet)-specific endonuclease VapC
MYLLDTNICIFILKNKTPALKVKFNAIKALHISAITYAELCFGIEDGVAHLKADRWKQLGVFTSRLTLLPWDESAAKQYGLLRSQLKKSGQMIGNNDLFIAAHAKSVNAILVTNNTREFSPVSELTLEDWSL